MSSLPRIYGVYLIHFECKLTGRAQHYIGWSPDVFNRLGQHRKNQGARILEVCNERGIGYKIARLWKGQGRDFERALKDRKNARHICPECSGKAARKRAVPRQAQPLPPHFIMADGTECPF